MARLVELIPGERSLVADSIIVKASHTVLRGLLYLTFPFQIYRCCAVWGSSKRIIAVLGLPFLCTAGQIDMIWKMIQVRNDRIPAFAVGCLSTAAGHHHVFGFFFTAFFNTSVLTNIIATSLTGEVLDLLDLVSPADEVCSGKDMEDQSNGSGNIGDQDSKNLPEHHCYSV